MIKTLRTLLVVACLPLFAFAQKTAPKRSAGPTTHSKPAWLVKPEWVRADEDFLASDALHGRGSATRDEEIAAEFVASKFESFGLKPGAPDKSYVERVELITPKLDGKAQLAAGDVTLNEPQDLALISSTGENATGKLIKVKADDISKAQIAPGSVVLITGLADDPRAIFGVTQRLRGSSVLTLLPKSNSLEKMFEGMMGGKTRVPTRVKGGESGGLGRANNVVMVAADAFAKLSALADGAQISLTVHAVPAAPVYTYNAIGVLEGTGPAREAVLLSAHLDHLGVRQGQTGDDNIYNGADDDAAGTTAVIELARALAAGPKPKRTVYFVCFGSEETGGQGDDFFRNNPPVPLEKIAANIEFEMIGAQDPKMPKGYVLLTGWERSTLGPTLKQHGAKVGPDPYPEQHFFERSDNYALALKGVVAHTAAGWGTPPYYHRPDDDLAHLDFAFMTEVIQSFVQPLEWLINSDFRPQWNAGGQPKGR